MRLRDLYTRIEACSDRCWEIPKPERIKHGLRAVVGEFDYSGHRRIELVRDLLSRVFRGTYPFQTEAGEAYLHTDIPAIYGSPQEVFAVAKPIVNELDQKLRAYEAIIQTAEQPDAGNRCFDGA